MNHETSEEQFKVELQALIGWMIDAAEGRPVSEFALSFHSVRVIADLRRDRDDMKCLIERGWL